MTIPKVAWVKVKGQMGQGQIRVPNKGRWAQDNVKLLHFMFCHQFSNEIIDSVDIGISKWG